jgi:branched-chain amino acid transport system permease protein
MTLLASKADRESGKTSFLARGSARTRLIWGVIAVAIFVWLLTGANGNEVFLGTTVVVYGIAAIGQDWLLGRAGQVSIGGAAFLAVGAYTTVITAGGPLRYFPIPLVLSFVIGAAIGLIIGMPALRLAGAYLLLATLALQYIVQFGVEEYQGISAGLTAPPLSIGAWTITGGRPLLILVTVVLLIVMVVLHNLYRHSPGNIWGAIREDPLASSAIGIGITRWKLMAFMGSSGVTALAGALFAYTLGEVSYETFSLTLGLSLVIMVFIGGPGSPIGVLIGAAVVTLFPTVLQDIVGGLPQGSSFTTWISTNAGQIETMLFGIALLLVLLFEPRGLIGIGRRVIRLVARWIRKTTEPPPFEAVPVTHAAATNGKSANGMSAMSESAAVHLDHGADHDNLLVVKGVGVTYRNGARGANDVNLVVPRKRIVAVVGRNGAGKTTTLRSIAGFLRSERVRVAGSIVIDGSEIARQGPLRTSHFGVAVVPERNKVFPSLTVAEHFKISGVDRGREEEIIDRFSALQPLLQHKAGHLSGGERQLLALSIAVATRPKLLLIDELSLGLSPIATGNMLDELVRLRDEDELSILLVDQAAAALQHVVDYFYVMEGGTIVREGSAGSISEVQVREAIIGR